MRCLFKYFCQWQSLNTSQEAKGLKLTVNSHHYPTDTPPSGCNVYFSLRFISSTLCIMPEARTVEELFPDNSETIPDQCQYPDRNRAFACFGGSTSHTLHIWFSALQRGRKKVGLCFASAHSSGKITSWCKSASFCCSLYLSDEDLNLYLFPQLVKSEVQSPPRAITGQVYQKIQQTVVHLLFIKYKQLTCLWMTVVLGRRWEGEMWGVTNRL